MSEKMKWMDYFEKTSTFNSLASFSSLKNFFLWYNKNSIEEKDYQITYFKESFIHKLKKSWERETDKNDIKVKWNSKLQMVFEEFTLN